MALFTTIPARQVAFVASMGALGNVLALVTLSIPTPVGQIAFDFSHIGTLVVALYSGPLLGGMTGALVGIAPYYRFGVAGGFGPVLGLMIIPGKSLTGITAGLLARKLRPGLATLVGYVPEAVFTFFYFEWVAPFFLGPKVGAYIMTLIVPVLAKAWLEMTVIAVVMELIRRQHILSRLMPKMN
jgi:riboflavin transporter FmnP